MLAVCHDYEFEAYTALKKFICNLILHSALVLMAQPGMQQDVPKFLSVRSQALAAKGAGSRTIPMNHFAAVLCVCYRLVTVVALFHKIGN